MSALQHELEAAGKAASPIVATLALCRAWALAPSSRLARLARGFARQIQVEPVPGANQEEREAAWLELASHAGPVELQELLAAPWSKKPKDAARRLSALARLGPDPRIVGSLLELDTGSRYASTAGHRFWQDVYELLLRWGSVEAVDRVPKDLPASEHTSPWNAARYTAIFQPLALRWAGRWPKDTRRPHRPARRCSRSLRCTGNPEFRGCRTRRCSWSNRSGCRGGMRHSRGTRRPRSPGCRRTPSRRCRSAPRRRSPRCRRSWRCPALRSTTGRSRWCRPNPARRTPSHRGTRNHRPPRDTPCSRRRCPDTAATLRCCSCHSGRRRTGSPGCPLHTPP